LKRRRLMPDPVPIRCRKCGAVLAEAVGGRRIPVRGKALTVGRVTLLCLACGAIKAFEPAKALDSRKPGRQTG
jgi:RNase P subunit RPR2